MKGIVFLALLFSAAAAFATTFVNRPLGDVIKEANIIVRGRPGEGFSDWGKGADTHALYTYTPFAVTEVIKGQLKETKIRLRQPGGSKDGTEMNVPGTAQFRPDEDVVVLLGPRNADDSYDVPGLATGKYNIVKGENGQPFLENSLGGAAMYDPRKDPNTISYNARVPLEVFRRVAKGEDVPEAGHRQFRQSADPAPKDAFEAGHSDAMMPKPTPSAAPAAPVPKATAEAAKVETHPPREPSGSGLWVPLSFALFGLIAAVVFWFVLRSGSKGGD